MKKVGVVSLGCSKNRVDSELMMGHLVRAGYALTNDPKDADILIVNTCGFIEPAKKESIDTILEMVRYKEGKCDTLVVTGCLSQRYRQELMTELPEVDLFLGVSEYDQLVPLLREKQSVGSNADRGQKPAEPIAGRVLTTPSYWAYLRIADGCDNRCTYCAIPGIRGNFVSRSAEDIGREAEKLVRSGVRELAVIAQDTTRYGLDLYGKRSLSKLLKELAKTDVTWIRLLYTYPEDIDDELLETMLESEKIVQYIDMPIQHADDAILARMNRRGNRARIASLVDRIRALDDRFVLRTTFIVGFPGESEAQFRSLCDFAREHPFDRAGAFAYSPEEGTPASRFSGEISEEKKVRRLNSIMEIQQRVSAELLRKRIGKTYDTLVEGFDEKSGLHFGRTYAEAAEIDGKILFRSQRLCMPGEFARVKITQTKEYDLIGEALQ